MNEAVNIVILLFMAVAVIGIVRARNLFVVVMLTGIYSLLAATIFVILDAVDVAFTEAAVGAGISTVLFLGTLALTTSEEKKPVHNAWISLAVVAVTGAVLIYGTLDMPRYGDPAAPANHHVVPEYLEAGPEKTGVPNVVTAVLASYRGYDTLGEVTVIFTAGIGVVLLLGQWRAHRRRNERGGGRGMSDLLVLRIVTKILMPFILLFALYVQFHGDYGPGGGFQAGVIFGAGFILYGLVYGLDALRGVLSSDVLRAGFAIGVLIFAGVGVAGLFLGGNYLDYNVLASDPVKGQHLGILLIEFGVGLTVASVMISIFYYFAGRGR